MELLKRLVKEENGQGLVEYVLIIALVAIICMVVLRQLGNTANTKLDEIETEIAA
jgi:pilus assembly protein Flp/PilA